MAKYLHRIFEMYDFRDEAISALTPKVESIETDLTPPDSWDFQHLNVSRSEGVTHVEFQQAKTFDETTVRELREDFTQLAEKLGRDSKVLLDFTGVDELSSAVIDTLVLFHKRLRAKGSRIALCSLDPTAKEAFFVAG